MPDPKALTRRDLLAAAAAATVGAAGLAASAPAEAAAVNDSGADLAARRLEADRLRVDLAREYSHHPLHHHPTNGDEESYPGPNGLPRHLGSYSKGLPHDDKGEVDQAAYESLLNALKSGDSALFDLIPLGGDTVASPASRRLRPAALIPKEGERFYRFHSERQTTFTGSKKFRLTNPQAGLAYDLEGADSHEFVMTPPPRFDGPEIVAEMAESYWMALARDVPFLAYASDAVPKSAADDLTGYVKFLGPKDGPNVTLDTLFRGSTSGDLVGPFVSQFLVRDIPFGAYEVQQKVVFAFPRHKNRERVFLNNAADYLRAQNGVASDATPAMVKTPRYISRGRDLANFVHIDELFQAYLNAALILGSEPETDKSGGRGGLGAPHDEGNPYDGYLGIGADGKIQMRPGNQAGFGTLGEPNIAALVAEVATRALKTVWYQKWFVHRRLRPEVFAGRIAFNEAKALNYPFDPHEYARLKRPGGVLEAVAKYNADRDGEPYFLPMAFPEGSPTHPSYGAGHATVAAACVTILKAFYHEQTTFAELNASIQIPLADGSDVVKLTAAKPTDPRVPGDYKTLAPQMTIGGELNKLAANVSLGRNFAGVHWRSDHAESLKLGEQLALQLLRETIQAYNEPVSMRVTRFDGAQVVYTNSR